MRLVLIKVVDETGYRFPEVVVTLYVDDTSLEGTGPPKQIVREVTEATRFLTNGLINMGMELRPSQRR